MSHLFEDYLASIGPEPDESEIVRRWHNAKEAVLWQAHYASRHSQSYRPFPVGCAVWAYKQGCGPAERWRVFRGANIKATKGNPKICAEMSAIMGATQAGYGRIVGIAVVGEPQADQGSGILSKTLPPCEACREAFRVLPSVGPDTFVILGKPQGDELVVEEMTIAELWNVHDHKAGP